MAKLVGNAARCVTVSALYAGALFGCAAPSAPRIPMAADAGLAGPSAPPEATPVDDPPPAPLPDAPIVRAPDAMLLASETVLNGLEEGIVTSDGEGGWSWSLTMAGCALLPLEVAPPDPGSATCARFAQEAFDDRRHRPLEVPAGQHTITLTNTHAASRGDAGLWIRALDRPSETALTAGGAAPGRSVAYRVTLGAGVYRISDPVSPSPDYLLVVTP